MSLDSQRISNFVAFKNPDSLDDWIVVLLLCCFFIICYTVGGNRPIFMSQINFFSPNRMPKGGGIVLTIPGFIHNLLLLALTSLCTGILLFVTLQEAGVCQGVPIVIVFRYALLIAAIFLIRLIIYHIVNVILFDHFTALVWTRFYYINFAFVGFFLFILSVITIFFNTSAYFSKVGLVVAVACFELVALYISFAIFFKKKCEYVYFFVYFCAMELIPTLIVWKFLTQTSSNIINFLL